MFENMSLRPWLNMPKKHILVGLSNRDNPLVPGYPIAASKHPSTTEKNPTYGEKEKKKTYSDLWAYLPRPRPTASLATVQSCAMPDECSHAFNDHRLN